MIFRDRAEAGRRLAAEIAALELSDPIVLALPRGGVPVGAAVAEALSAPLDVMIVRKVGAPDNPELAIAAIVDGDPPEVILNRAIVEAYGLEEDEIAWLVKGERPELERRRNAFRGGRRALSVREKTAIVVDDGAATGATMKVALRALKRRGPREIVVALPVAPPDTVFELGQEADRVICLSQPPGFRALSLHYHQFPQLADEEVKDGLHAAASRMKAMRKAGRT